MKSKVTAENSTPKNSLPDGIYLFEWGGLIANAGGMTRAMLKRANSFINEGAKVRILLSARGMEQLDAISYYKENGYPLIERENFVTLEEYFGSKLYDPKISHKPGKAARLKSLPAERPRGGGKMVILRGRKAVCGLFADRPGKEK